MGWIGTGESGSNIRCAGFWQRLIFGSCARRRRSFTVQRECLGGPGLGDEADVLIVL